MPQVGLFFQGLLAGFGGSAVSSALGTILGGAYGAGITIGAFAAGPIGSLLLNVGASALIAALNRPRAPSTADARVNVRLPNAPRWLAGGTAAVGGALGTFMEFDEDGNFWFAVAHTDGELTGTPTYILDGITVTLSDGTDGFTAGDVLTDDFCVNGDGDPYEGDGTRVPVWRIYTVTPGPSTDYGALPAAFTSAFANLPSDFRGAGVVFSIVRGAVVKPEKRYNVYRWRGGLGVGEPSVVMVGNFERMYDPREVSHDINDPSTWTAGNGNPAIVWGWFRTHARGKGQPMTAVNWAKVEEWADIFDTTVNNRNGDPVPLYRAGVAFPDNKPRHECEDDILATCDGFVAYDETGKAYIVGGYYQAPTLTFTAERDILSAQTQVVDDAETPLDGVVVEYVSPSHGYTKQASAPWVNDDWYDGTSEPNYLTIPIHGCQDHNQAVRLAKATGQRIGATKRIGLETTVKGVLAMSKRAVSLAYDAQFTGVFELVGSVQEDGSGSLCRFAAVSLATDRWTLGVGEEGAPPQPSPALNIDTTLELAANVSIVAAAVGNGAALRLEATFDAPTRVDRVFRFRYVPTAGGNEEYFVTDMDQNYAYSSVLETGVEYRVSWQTVTAGGRATVWSDERDTPVFVDITVAQTAVAIAALSEPAPLGAVREVSGWRGGDNVTVIGDGYWWREATTGEIVTNARFVADFEAKEYQIDAAAKTRAKVLGLTRATTGRIINSDADLATIAIDLPRFDWTTGRQSLLLEPAATNLCLWSEDISNAAWSKFRASTGGTLSVFDGAATLTKLVEDSTTNTHILRQSFSVTNGDERTASWMIKAAELSTATLRMQLTGMTLHQVLVDLDLGTVANVNGTPAAEIYPLAEGVYLVTMRATATATGTMNLDLHLTNDAGDTNYLGDGSSGLYVGPVQFEAGLVATSYIPTTTTSASRSADVPTMKGISATLDLTAIYDDGTTDTFAGTAVTAGTTWPALTDNRLAALIGRTP